LIRSEEPSNDLILIPGFSPGLTPFRRFSRSETPFKTALKGKRNMKEVLVAACP
jgi:hypothetical protein